MENKQILDVDKCWTKIGHSQKFERLHIVGQILDEKKLWTKNGQMLITVKNQIREFFC